MSDIQDQPPPVRQPDKIPVWDLVVADFKGKNPPTITGKIIVQRTAVNDVIDDMVARDAVGRERYGTPLTTHNGRDHVVDAYQELLDAAVYTKAAMLEGERHHLEPLYWRLLEDLVSVRRLINERAEKKS